MRPPAGRCCVHATRKKGNVYAARLVLNRKKGALRCGKALRTVVLPSLRAGRRAVADVDPDCVALLQNRGNFWKSGVPSRVMYYQDGGWRNFPSSTVEEVKRAFGDGKPAVIVESDGSGDGSRYVLDFLRMLQVDLKEEVERSIAWIDGKDRCFFPRTFVDGREDADSGVIKLKLEINVDKLTAGSKDGEESGEQSETKVVEGGDEEGVGENKAEESPARDGGESGGDNEGGLVEGSGESGAVDGVVREGSGEHGRLPGAREEGGGKNGSEKGSVESEGAEAGNEHGNDGSGCSQDSDASRERIARIPDLNKFESGECQLEHLADACQIVETLSAGGSLAKKVRIREVSHLMDSSPCKAHMSNPRDEANRASLKRTQNNLGSSGYERNQDDFADPGKRARLSPERESRNREKPKFDSMGTVLAKLPDDNTAYVGVKNLFQRGMAVSDMKATVRAIYWCSHASPTGATRLQAFNQNADSIKATRGSSNVRYAWYGGSPGIIESVVLHGFGRLGTGNGENLYGVGVHLTPESQSYESVCRSKPDEDNVYHAVLCRVIMGNMEQIELGSPQYQPKDTVYDSGVDNLENPKWYIVWSTHMNTYILPEYVVSFTVPKQLQDAWKRKFARLSATGSRPYAPLGDTLANNPSIGPTSETLPVSRSNSPSSDAQTISRLNAPSSDTQASGITHLGSSTVNATGLKRENSQLPSVPSFLSFPALFAALRSQLPQSVVETLENLHADFKAGKCSKDVLVKRMRAIAGDRPLRAAIQNIRGQV